MSLHSPLHSHLHLHLRRLLAACGALLAGCATTPLPDAVPTLRVPPAWQAPLPGVPDTVASSSADLGTWWQRFGDAQLPVLVSAAQAASPTLASAAARIERARANRVAAGAALLPRLDASSGLSHGRVLLGDPLATTATLGLQASWEIDLLGGNTAGRNAAQARLESAQAAFVGARVAVAAELATSYIALRACEATLAQRRADAASREQTARLTGLSERAGFTAPADAALARAGAAQSRSIATSQRAACDQLVQSLVALTDVPEADLRQRLAPGTATQPQPAAVAPPALPAALLTQRPDLTAAARNVLAAAGERTQARSFEGPQLGLQGTVGGVGVRTGGFRASGPVWTLGPLTLSLPLFDGGAAAANTRAAQAAYDEAVLLLQAQLRQAVREVENALVALQAGAEREADARLAAQDFEASLRATEARQRGGLASLIDLENARRDAVQARIALVDLQRERAAAWVSLYRALGGGYDEAALAAAAPAQTPSSTPATPATSATSDLRAMRATSAVREAPSSAAAAR